MPTRGCFFPLSLSDTINSASIYRKKEKKAHYNQSLKPTRNYITDDELARKNVIVKGVEDGWVLQFVSEIVKHGSKLD
jgi:hypothetical protein